MRIVHLDGFWGEGKKAPQKKMHLERGEWVSAIAGRLDVDVELNSIIIWNGNYIRATNLQATKISMLFINLIEECVVDDIG
jgi:hypothetical protein